MEKFYKTFTGIFILCLFGKISFAQTETDTTFFTQMNYIFANVDKSKVPYGILRDFGMEFTNIENYSGTAALVDSNYADADAFWDVYQTLLTSRVSTSATGFVPAATADSLWYIQRQPGKIVLSSLYFNYSRFKDNAAGNYITISNNQLYDKYVGGVWQNPYQSEQVFLISTPVNFYQGQSLQIVLPSNLTFTNNLAGITSIQIDPGDGAGYRTLGFNQPLNINYSDTGLKQWTYKLTISGGTVLYSHSQIVIQTDYSTGGGSARMMSAGEVFPPSPFIATKQYMGVPGKGYATIQYANPDHILRKPLIVAEGFDPGYITKPEEKFGETSLATFELSVNVSQSSNLISLLNGSPAQYDVVYVDWKNGTDYLQRNAYLLETIIQWVNANKQPLNGVIQPNVVMGQSMGGVIARYALKDMENTGINHQTRLYISDDAPHLGANVPEGYQHLARHARGLYIRAGVSTIIVEIIQLIRGGASPLAALSLADQPASKQMLINFVNGYNTIDNSVHTAWETELKNLGYPQGSPGTTFKKVAVSNGSECGQPQPFNAGANLLTYSGKANTRILGDLAGIAGLPIAGALTGQPFLFLGIIPGRNDFNFDFYVNAQADGYSNQIYHGKITYTKKILWLVPVTATLTNRNYNSNASTLPYDYFPGGYYDLRDANVDLNSSTNQNLFFKYNITANDQPTFCFVPTASALDIGSNNVTLTKTDYLTSYVGAFPPAAPKNTPFQNFITAYFNGKINEHHISIERRNGDWIAAELNSLPQSANCSLLCNNITISGNAGLCTPSTYSVSGFSGNATYIWSASPLGIVTISPNGSQATITRIQNGTVTISVTIQSSCGGNFTPSLPIVVGAPVITSIASSMTGGCNGLYQDWNLSAVANTSVSSWSWTVDNPANNNWIIYSPHTPNTIVGVTGGGGITISATNVCGTGKGGVTIWSNCHYGAITAFPNPTTGDVSVELAQPTAQPSVETKTNATSSNTKQPMIYQIIVTDQLGNLKKQYKYSAGISNAKVSLNGLASGMYIIRAFDGVLWNSVKVIKE